LVYEVFTPKLKKMGSDLPLLKEEILKTKYFQHLAILSTLALLFPLGALARDNAHSVDIFDAVQIGGTQLKPGNYKVEWQGEGPAVQVSFQHNGKTVATVPATLKTNDAGVTRDAIMTEATGPDTVTLQRDRFRSSETGASIWPEPGWYVVRSFGSIVAGL